jgi:hypothetical protein
MITSSKTKIPDDKKSITFSSPLEGLMMVMDLIVKEAEPEALNTLPEEKSQFTTTFIFDSPIIESCLLLL